MASRPAPLQGRTTWATFLRRQAQAIVACDFFTATTLTGTTVYVFAVIEHATRHVRILGANAHPTGKRVTQLARNLVRDPQEARTSVKYLIRDRDAKFTTAFDAVSTGEGIQIVTTGVRMPRMGTIMERWARTARPHPDSTPGRPRFPGRALTTSPFVREAPVVPTTADFQVGDRVTLDSRGIGRVIEVTAEYVIVGFGADGRRRIPAGTKGFSRL